MSAQTGRPAITADALRERARELLPTLEARVGEADRARRLPEQTVEDLQGAGFFRILQPTRWGGLELHPQVFFDVQTTLASACPSTAWVLGVVAVHSWQLALFPLEAQQEVWGSDSSTLISSSYAPVGKVQKADGGFKLSGRWSFSSGSDHCQWAFLGAFCPPAEGAKGPDMRTFLVPRRDYRIEDTWHVSGLKGTGSNDIVVDDVFVPEHRTHAFKDGFLCRSPGNAVNPAPLYRLPFGQIFVRSVSSGAIGMLDGALQAYLGYQRSRVASADGQKIAEDATAQLASAEAEAVLDELRLVLARNLDEMMRFAESEEKLPIERRVKFRYDSARVVTKCVAAIDQLFTASGGRAIFSDNPVQRFFQDVHAARAHYANNPDKPGRNAGGVLFGMPSTDFFI